MLLSIKSVLVGVSLSRFLLVKKIDLFWWTLLPLISIYIDSIDAIDSGGIMITVPDEYETVHCFISGLQKHFSKHTHEYTTTTIFL